MRKRNAPEPKRFFLFEKVGEEHIDPNPEKPKRKSCHVKDRNQRIKINNTNIQTSPELMSYDCHDGSDSDSENYVDKPDVYAPQVFLTLFKTAVKLLPIFRKVENDNIWKGELDSLFEGYMGKKRRNSRIDDLCKAYEVILTGTVNAQENH